MRPGRPVCEYVFSGRGVWASGMETLRLQAQQNVEALGQTLRKFNTWGVRSVALSFVCSEILRARRYGCARKCY